MNGLLVDDDALFLRTLQRSLQRRGIEAVIAPDVATALAAARARPFDFALVDLKIGKESGLRLVGPLKEIRSGMTVVMMTGYASVATAVEAIKAGADDYLLKPVSVDTILRVLADEPNESMDDPETMTPLGRLEWEHIQQALRTTDGNVSAAARLLGVHRRSLQRKLSKRPAPSPGAPETD
jgi:two-component system response regulator RegA